MLYVELQRATKYSLAPQLCCTRWASTRALAGTQTQAPSRKTGYLRAGAEQDSWLGQHNLTLRSAETL